MRTILLALTLAAGGCEQADDEAESSEFDRNFRAACVSAAVRGNASEAVATEVCDCTLAGINARFSTSEKLAISAEQAQPITAECMAKAGLE